VTPDDALPHVLSPETSGHGHSRQRHLAVTSAAASNVCRCESSRSHRTWNRSSAEPLNPVGEGGRVTTVVLLSSWELAVEDEGTDAAVGAAAAAVKAGGGDGKKPERQSQL
jgi:hypothetical protein